MTKRDTIPGLINFRGHRYEHYRSETKMGHAKKTKNMIVNKWKHGGAERSSNYPGLGNQRKALVLCLHTENRMTKIKCPHCDKEIELTQKFPSILHMQPRNP